MKYIKQILLFILFTGINASVHCNQTDLKQREHAVKEFIRQEIEKGTSLEIIQQALYEKAQNNPERQTVARIFDIWSDLSKQAQQKNCFTRGSWGPFENTPDCQLLEKDYDAAKEAYEKNWNSYADTPEYRAENALSDYIDIQNSHLPDKKEEFQKFLQKKQKLAEELGLPQESNQ